MCLKGKENKMKITTKLVASMVDHTNLKAFATEEDFQKLCDEAKEYGFKSVAINTYPVAMCRKMLEGSNVLTGAAVGFPLGQTTIESKVFEAQNAIDNGAQEFDYVQNVGRAKMHDIDKLMRRLADLKIGDTLVLAGTIPSSIPDTIYSDIMQQLANKQIDFVVDATNELLLNVLKYRPFLIKPNNHELEEIFSVNLETKKDVIPFAKKLQEKGARNVLVSLAGEGAVLLDELGHVYISSAPSGKLINAVGAGDSMVAGFLAGYKEDNNYMHAFMMGLASGSASAFSPVFATKSEVLNVYQQIMSPDFDIHEGGDTAHIEADALGEVRAHAMDIGKLKMEN